MLKRGMKRKFPLELEDQSAPDDYQKGLSDFQSAARKRESMRIKASVTFNINSSKNEKNVNSPFSSNPTLFWERSLTEKIGVEQKLVDGTAKFIIAAGKNEQQCLEAAKTLKVASLRVDMLKYELNKFRRGRASPQLGKQCGKPSYAGVSLSDIRIPLVWRGKDVNAEEGQKRAHKFAVFCIARIGSQIYDTCLVNPVDDLSTTDVSFTDVILFNKIAPHFELTLEIYAHALDLNKDKSSSGSRALISETPQKIAKSISKAMGKRLKTMIDTDTTEGLSSINPNKKVGPKFEMVGTVSITLDDCHPEIQTHEMYIDDSASPTCPSFFGQLCCRVAALPYCCEDEVISGAIGIRNYKGKVQNKWCRLLDWKLSFWNDKSQKEAARRPNNEIPINRNTCILEEGLYFSFH